MRPHSTLAAPICGGCDRDLEFTKPCYFWPLKSPFRTGPDIWALVCEQCFGEMLAADAASEAEL